MKLEHFRINGYENPVGLAVSSQISFDWRIEQMRAKGLMLTRLLVYTDPECKHELASLQGETLEPSGQILQLAMKPRSRYYAKLQAVSLEREACESPIAIFETGKGEEVWQGQWIQAAEGENLGFLKLFSLEGAEEDWDDEESDHDRRIVSARLYVSSNIPSQILLNGTPLALLEENMLGTYLTLNVSNLISDENLLEILPQGRGEESFAAIAELYVKRTNGTEECIQTDESWNYRREEKGEWLPVTLGQARPLREFPQGSELN